MAGKQGGTESSSNSHGVGNELVYEEMETPEGERKISRIAKARDKMTKDFTKNNQIKDEQRVILRDLVRIMGRWKGYFVKRLNEENRRSVLEDGVPTGRFDQFWTHRFCYGQKSGSYRRGWVG